MKKDEREWKGKVLTIGFLYLEMEVVCVEFGCHFEVEIEYECTLSSLEVLQGFSFFLQMGFTLILATLDGLDVGLLEDVIGEDDCDDDCDDDDCDEEMSLVRMEKKLRNINFYVKFKVAKQIEITSCYKGTIAKVLPGYIIKDVFLVTRKNHTPSNVEKSSVASPRKKEAGYDLQPICGSWSFDLEDQNISQVSQLCYAKSTKHQPS
ncbi:hypothetical protein Tco_0448924 [Tanacetum coccineum]